MPVPKVIDFGIAKAAEGRLTDATVLTGNVVEWAPRDAGGVRAP